MTTKPNIPTVAWVPEYINYVPTNAGVKATGGRILDKYKFDRFIDADLLANKLNNETRGANGYYVALYT